MKKIIVIALCLTTLFSFQACKNNQPSAPEGMPKALLDSMSMAVGVFLTQVLDNQVALPELDYSIIFKTMKKIRDGKDVGIDPMKMNEIAQKYYTTKQELVTEQNQKKGAEFLAKNKTKDGVVELESGVQYKIIEEGTGIQPDSPADTVTVHYTGTLIDGTQFDSSFDEGRGPFTTPLNNTIPGWFEAFQHLKEGTKAFIYIPADMGYGQRQMSQVLTPYSTLIFEVELIHVSKAVVVEEEVK
ncbi:MAG: FKBP-type peptidyl-prolyl cis-trans isomerase [Prevotellaceae bacterium]|jgi:FKBP-type peptidyl-prolyl cis-trans isomerase|nr:FKBP-type peptidyl-prolyl cis-trans isomerase [Prevotellaceae bacterium]